MQPGLYFNIPMVDYLAIDAMSSHKLFNILESPEYYKAVVDGRVKIEQTRPMLMGSLGHSLTLEGRTDWVVCPDTYASEAMECPLCLGKSDSKRCRKCNMPRVLVSVQKEWNANATECREWTEAQTLEVVSAQESSDLIGASEAVLTDPIVAPIMSHGKPEVTVIAEYAGLLFKGRVDWLEIAQEQFFDLKNTQDASTRAFSIEIDRRGYYRQLALYWKLLAINGIEIERCGICAVEQFSPYLRNFRWLKPRALELGQQELDGAIDLLAKCARENKWPGYSGDGPEAGEIDLPEWKYADGEALELTVGGTALTM